MKKVTSFMVLFLAALLMFSAEEKQEIKSYGIDFSAGLRFDYNRAKVELGADGTVHHLVFPFLAVQADVGISNSLTLGLVAGYSRDFFEGTVGFFGLPLSLQSEKETLNTLVLGLNLESELFSFGDFALTGRGEFLYFSSFKRELPIRLPIVTGTAALNNSFYQLSADLVLGYYGISGVVLFLGPRVNFIKGKFKADETIEDIAAEQSLDFREKNFIDFTAGFTVEIGSSLELTLSGSYFSKVSLAAGLFYLF